jgi:ParB family transcriptional regulator, chromosome partitioning protein
VSVALDEPYPPPEGETSGVSTPDRPRENLRYIPIDHIVPNPRQPRVSWEPAALEELTRSIIQRGLLEPIILRPVGANRYEIVAGERRWRACKAAGWNEVPAIVRSMEENESLEAALIENIQRADLNAVEEARAYSALSIQFGLTHDEIAKRVSKDRSTVTNLLRLLVLPEDVLGHVSRGTLTPGHARVLISVPEEYQLPIAERMVHEGWSVRKAETWARGLARGSGQIKRRIVRGNPKPENIFRLEEQLCRHFGAEVRVRMGRKGGRLEITYFDDEDLSRLLDLLGIVVP